MKYHTSIVKYHKSKLGMRKALWWENVVKSHEVLWYFTRLHEPIIFAYILYDTSPYFTILHDVLLSFSNSTKCNIILAILYDTSRDFTRLHHQSFYYDTSRDLNAREVSWSIIRFHFMMVSSHPVILSWTRTIPYCASYNDAIINPARANPTTDSMGTAYNVFLVIL